MPDDDSYDPASIRHLAVIEPSQRRLVGRLEGGPLPTRSSRTGPSPSREERLARLSPEDRAAVEVWSLGRRARDMAAAGDPDAPSAEAAYREAEAAAIEAEILMRRVDVEDLKARYPVLARDAEVTVGVGWQPLLEGLLDRLAGMSVVVPLVREKFGGLDAKVYPVGSWIHAEFDAMDGIKEPAKEEALRTCEACGAPGTMRRDGRWRTRCDRHAAM